MNRLSVFPAFLLLTALVAGALFVSWWRMIAMPGKSFVADPPSLSPGEFALRADLAAHVQTLAGEIGERNLEHYPKLVAAADYIVHSLEASGLAPRRTGYEVEGKTCENIEAEVAGTRREILVIGAHYDSVVGSPGANDNGSGVAALLTLAHHFAGNRDGLTLRFVAFPNEEPGHFQTRQMGSWVYAKRCKENADPIVGMISLETIGYFSTVPRSQKYPIHGLGAIYPSTGNFIAFVGNIPSGALVRKAIGSFRRHAIFPSQGAALPAGLPGVGWSDHWSFWQHGYPALMVTDTAPFRYPYYHARSDTPDKLDYDSMARLVHGLQNSLGIAKHPALGLALSVAFEGALGS